MTQRTRDRAANGLVYPNTVFLPPGHKRNFANYPTRGVNSLPRFHFPIAVRRPLPRPTP